MQRSSRERQLEVAVGAARVAGEVLQARFGQVQQVRHKGEIDLVTEADEAAETAIVREIRRTFPADRVLAEEGTSAGDDPERLWIVDPLDGTTNFAHGYPIFAVSIALEIAGVVELGGVYQPILEELFTAIRGQGAQLNGAPIAVSATEALLESMVCTGFPYDRTQMAAALDIWERIVPNAQAARRDGSAATDLCYVAMGRFDGFWERWLQPWDVAASALIAAEAGGRLTDYQGNPLDIRSRQIVATNGHIHDDLLARINARGEG